MELNSIVARLTPYREKFEDDEDFSEFANDLCNCNFDDSKFMLFLAFEKEDLNLFQETLAFLKEKFLEDIDIEYFEVVLECFSQTVQYMVVWNNINIVYYSKQVYRPMLEALLGEYVDEFELVFEENEQMLALHFTKNMILNSTYNLCQQMLSAYKLFAATHSNEFPVMIARERTVWCQEPLSTQILDIFSWYKHPLVQYEYLFLYKYGESMGVDMLCSLAEF